MERGALQELGARHRGRRGGGDRRRLGLAQDRAAVLPVVPRRPALAKTCGAGLLEEARAKACARTSRPSCKTIEDTVGVLARGPKPTDEDVGAYLRGEGYCEDIEGLSAGEGKNGER